MSRHTSVRATLGDYPGEDTNPTLRDLAARNPPLLTERSDALCYPVAEAPPPPARPMSGKVWKGPPVLRNGVIHHGQMTITEGHGVTPASR